MYSGSTHEGVYLVHVRSGKRILNDWCHVQNRLELAELLSQLSRFLFKFLCTRKALAQLIDCSELCVFVSCRGCSRRMVACWWVSGGRCSGWRVSRGRSVAVCGRGGIAQTRKKFLSWCGWCVLLLSSIVEVVKK